MFPGAAGAMVSVLEPFSAGQARRVRGESVMLVPQLERRVTASALALAALGIVVQIVAGVKYPTVPPGLIILLGAAAAVAFLARWWAPLTGVTAGGFILIGGFVSAQGRYDLSHPGQVGVFAGTLLQFVALGAAVIAGLAAVRGGQRRAESS
jgi:hypothetical protein